MLTEEAPDLKFKEVQTRALIDISQILIWASTIGAFSGLWKVIELWVKRYANASIKMNYKAQDGSTVDVEYNNLTKKEAEKFLTSHPPKTENPVKIVLLQHEDS